MRKLLLFLVAALGSLGIAGAQCLSSFTATPSPQNNNLLRVTFNNTSSYGLPFAGQIKGYLINYDDGTVVTVYSSNQNLPDHVYTAPGTYNVGLRIFSIDSATNFRICTDSNFRVVTVGYPSCGTTMNISGTGATRNFTANTPGSPSGMTYTWNYGDGSTATGAAPSHTYAASGFYTVTLTATRANPACSYTNQQTVYISLPPAPLNCASLSANFSAAVNTNQVVTTNTSSTVPGPPYITTAFWTYGDGATATGLNPAPHLYSAQGVYTVTLYMTWRDSLSLTICTDTAQQVIAVTSMPVPVNVISGEVRYDSLTHGINSFKVWLIKLDSATNTLAAVDSQITGNTANAYYAFGNKPAGAYRTKAAVYQGAISGTGLIPTYHDTSTYWTTARQIFHNGGSSTQRHIYMHSGNITPGPGFIGGNVSFGANKGTANGVRNFMVFLRDRSERVIAMTYTDSLGNYSFANLAYGAYSVHPEMLNIVTTPITPIVLNATSDRLATANFSYDEARRSIAPRATLTVQECNCLVGVTVSPVPAHDKVSITWSNSAEGELQFFVTSITGQAVARTEMLHGKAGHVSLDVNHLSPGIYFVRGTGMASGSINRIVIQ